MRILVIAISFILLSCSSKQIKNISSWNEKDNTGVQVTVDWIKHKSEKIDASITITNAYGAEIIIPENSVQCFVDKTGSVESHSNPRIILSAGARHRFVYNFDFGTNIKSAKEVEFKVQNIFAGVPVDATITESKSTAHSFSTASARSNGRVVEGNGFGVAKVDSSSKTYQGVAFKESKKLPSAVVTFDLLKAKQSR